MMTHPPLPTHPAPPPTSPHQRPGPDHAQPAAPLQRPRPMSQWNQNRSAMHAGARKRSNVGCATRPESTSRCVLGVVRNSCLHTVVVPLIIIYAHCCSTQQTTQDDRVMPRRLPKVNRADQPPRPRAKASSVGVAAFDELLQRWAKQPPPEAPKEPSHKARKRPASASTAPTPRSTRACGAKEGVYPACQPPDLQRCSVTALKTFLQQVRWCRLPTRQRPHTGRRPGAGHRAGPREKGAAGARPGECRRMGSGSRAGLHLPAPGCPAWCGASGDRRGWAGGRAGGVSPAVAAGAPGQAPVVWTRGRGV